MNLNKENRSIDKQIKRFLCLFGETNAKRKCYKSQLDLCTNHLCGCPVFVWSLFGLLNLLLIGCIIYLSVALIQLSTINMGYFSKCSTNADCNLSMGLQCASQDHTCDCPAGLTKGRCDCNLGTYWSGTECKRKLSFNQSGCVHDYNCDVEKGLLCINFTCQCKKPKYWDSNQGMCDYYYEGCYNFWGISSTQIFFRRTAPHYFAETCVERCYAYNFTYAILFWNNVQRCSCGFTKPTSSATCNIYCSGEKPRYCGRINDTASWDQFRSMYRAS